jgi:hypothetical protein
VGDGVFRLTYVVLDAQEGLELFGPFDDVLALAGELGDLPRFRDMMPDQIVDSIERLRAPLGGYPSADDFEAELRRNIYLLMTVRLHSSTLAGSR